MYDSIATMIGQVSVDGDRYPTSLISPRALKQTLQEQLELIKNGKIR